MTPLTYLLCSTITFVLACVKLFSIPKIAKTHTHTHLLSSPISELRRKMAETVNVVPDFATKYQNINDFYKFVEATDKDDGSKALKFICQMCLPIKRYYKTDTKAPMSNLRYYIQ